MDLEHNKSLNILGFAPEILNILLELADNSENIHLFNVLENIPSDTSEHYVPLDRYKVIFTNFYDKNHPKDKLGLYAFGVVGTKSKEIVYNYFKQNIGMNNDRFINLIHKQAHISNSVKLNYGTQIGGFTSVNVLTEIGFGVNIRNNCYIGHHGKIGDFVTLNPGVTVNGLVEIGNNTQIGAGAIIRDQIKIGSNCIIGMGSNVINSIPDNSIAYGNPCKVHKTNK